MKVFAVYDTKAGAYMTPYFAPTTGVGVRLFVDVVSDVETMFHKHPEDFTLYEVAEWDEYKGRFVNYQNPEVVFSGRSLADAPGAVLSPAQVDLETATANMEKLGKEKTNGS